MAKLETRQVAEFGSYFKDHLSDYSIIGGAATLLHLDERMGGTHNKATKDLDIAVLDLSSDGKSSAFLSRFNQYVDEMEYEVFVGKTNKSCAYRFVNPKNALAPYKIEIATRQMEGLKLKGQAQRLNEFDISAIVCDPMYIEHLKNNSEPKNLSGQGGSLVNVARVGSIILMKALAYINLIGIEGMKDHAGRHAADIVRLSGVLRDSDRIQVHAEIYAPFEKLVAMRDSAFPAARVDEIRGFGITADRVVSDIQQFISSGGGGDL